MKSTEINATVTVGQVLDYLADENNPGAGDLRETKFTRTITGQELAGLLRENGALDASLGPMGGGGAPERSGR